MVNYNLLQYGDKIQNTVTRYHASILYPSFIRMLEIATQFLNGYYDCF